MKLYFENAYGETRKISDCMTHEDVYKEINNFIARANAAKPKGTKPFKTHYIRSWQQDGKTWYDVGSHSEFFYTME